MESLLNISDWKQLAAQGKNAAAPRKPSFGKAPSLHLRAKPASRAEELARAKEIIDLARESIAYAFACARGGDAIDATAFVPIVNAVAASLNRNATALPSLIRLRDASEAVYFHAIGTSGLMISMARELRLTAEEVADFGMAGLLLDIGMTAVPAEILAKEGPLDENEQAAVKRHCELGCKMLAEAGGVSDFVLQTVLQHHERLNGSGYPYGLRGDEIGLGARVAAICDSFDAGTSPRAYAQPLTAAQLIDELRGSPDEYDSSLVTVFVRMLGAFLPGAMVRLASERLAVIVDEGEDPLNPPVIAFHCIPSNGPLEWQRVDTHRDRIIGIERPDRWAIHDWPELRRMLMRWNHENRPAQA
ncbi:HD domain-containing phosphohydrolase [Sphingomonas sp. BGYR3]|uniref:HD-GYP domain-containing protein n=1 Tax=Sphingomonas sp. BGYR3 TaxID=2975483 RepID=UPI0021A81243|nr:HD domain-containing phosphohydrolase [Sphingomonas sp. BGYR3]MDG5489305.1 HD domain-containing phosphohydrolase [Sphingomonas sp. BGYR3]